MKSNEPAEKHAQSAHILSTHCGVEIKMPHILERRPSNLLALAICAAGHLAAVEMANNGKLSLRSWSYSQGGAIRHVVK